MIEARGRVKGLGMKLAEAFAEATHLLEAALTQEDDNATARVALADLWSTRLEAAERRRDESGAAYALSVIERYSHEPLRRDGSLTLKSDPPRAEVVLYRYEEEDGVLAPTEEKPLGQTPFGPVALPMGSYLCILKKEGYRDTRYPVHITRNRKWEGNVKLRTDDEIGDGFVYVPAGPFVHGEGKDTTEMELPDIAIAKYPVTFQEYAEFLESLRPEEARERLPRAERPYMSRWPDGRFRPVPEVVDGPALGFCQGRYGGDFAMRLPVIGVSWDDAVAYCKWMTQRTGKEWRLPTDAEREKGARGVDGRRFPWGDLEDESLAKTRDSRVVNPQPEPVGAFPTAESVYGMGDAAGGVWDWTGSWFEAAHSSRIVRGGSWYGPVTFGRCAYRFWYFQHERAAHIGFRCARGL